MECLGCGDCCLRMSPLSAPEPCPHLIQDGDIYSCSIYENRPAECAKHELPGRYCPIGIEKLKLTESWQVSQRIDLLWEKRRKC